MSFGNTKKILNERSLASLANQRINEIKINTDSNKLNFSLFLGKNILFPNLTIEENFLHQSRLKSFDELRKMDWCPLQRETIETNIINFKNFYPRNIPEDLLVPISFLCTILQRTDYCLYSIESSIPPVYQSIAEEIIINYSKIYKKIFINLDQSTENKIIYLSNEKITTQKKAS